MNMDVLYNNELVSGTPLKELTIPMRSSLLTKLKHGLFRQGNLHNL